MDLVERLVKQEQIAFSMISLDITDAWVTVIHLAAAGKFATKHLRIMRSAKMLAIQLVKMVRFATQVAVYRTVGLRAIRNAMPATRVGMTIGMTRMSAVSILSATPIAGVRLANSSQVHVAMELIIILQLGKSARVPHQALADCWIITVRMNDFHIVC